MLLQAARLPWQVVGGFIVTLFLFSLLLRSDESQSLNEVEAAWLPKPSEGTFEEFREYFGLSSSSVVASGSPSAPDVPSVQYPIDTIPASLIDSALRDDGQEYLAVCLIVKDQALDLPEWFIHNYHHAGVRRFYVIDDGSEPPIEEQMKDVPDLPRNSITWIYHDRKDYPGAQQLNDELLEYRGNQTVTEILQGFEKDDHVGGLVVSWRTHTSNGHLTRQPSYRKAYTECVPIAPENDNANFKSITLLKNFVHMPNVHQIITKDGTTPVDEHGVPQNGVRRFPTIDRIALHHYGLKSREEYEQKMQRGNANMDPKQMDYWERVSCDFSKVLFLGRANNEQVERDGKGHPCPEMAKWDP